MLANMKLSLIMDFSVTANLREDPDQPLHLKPFLKKPVYTASSLSSPKSSRSKPADDVHNLSIFSISAPKNPAATLPVPIEKPASVINKTFEETLGYHKDFKSIEPIRHQFVRFVKNGKVYQVMKNDFRRLVLESGHKRSQTAFVVRQMREKSRERGKDAKGVKRELLPQTKACGARVKPAVFNMTVQGVVKDIKIRRFMPN
jgi:hypothetical protein